MKIFRGECQLPWASVPTFIPGLCLVSVRPLSSHFFQKVCLEASLNFYSPFLEVGELSLVVWTHCTYTAAFPVRSFGRGVCDSPKPPSCRIVTGKESSLPHSLPLLCCLTTCPSLPTQRRLFCLFRRSLSSF